MFRSNLGSYSAFNKHKTMYIQRNVTVPLDQTPLISFLHCEESRGCTYDTGGYQTPDRPLKTSRFPEEAQKPKTSLNSNL